MFEITPLRAFIFAATIATLATWYRHTNNQENRITSINPAPRYVLRSGKEITHAFHTSRDSYWLNISTNGNVRLVPEKDKPSPTIYPTKIIHPGLDFNGDGTNDIYVSDNKGREHEFLTKGLVWRLNTKENQ